MPTRDSGRRRVLCLALLCGALACGSLERTALFTLRQRIPLGPITVSVEGWEGVGEVHAPLSSLRTPQGEKAIAVFAGWSGLDPFAEPDRQIFAERFLRDALVLVDSDGFGYKPVAAMSRRLYDASVPSSPAPRDYVVIFHVGAGSRGYTLRLSHPDQEEDAFDVAIVPLG